ncbi:sugar phosphate nucleotidyltransferase [Dactylosporangium sp. CA-139066]|uniref:sugar phosphate nucleotidyltransferase n=1 Tax=Dactylosporangium sp. CA-139066 TaxID=3239930 RepID=UPI003D8C53B4
MRIGAIIATGGVGARFFPLTKAVPKVMLPVLERPILEYLLDECLFAGVARIAVVHPVGDRCIADYLADSAVSRRRYHAAGLGDRYDALVQRHGRAAFTFLTQPDDGRYGSLLPLLLARRFLGSDTAYLLAGDDLLLPADEPSLLARMAASMRRTGADAVVAGVVMDDRRAMRYGNIVTRDGVWLDRIAEKPRDASGVTGLAYVGRLLSSPGISDLAASIGASPDTGELQIVDVINRLASTGRVAVETVAETYFDCGVPNDWLNANIAAAARSRLPMPRNG